MKKKQMAWKKFLAGTLTLAVIGTAPGVSVMAAEEAVSRNTTVASMVGGNAAVVGTNTATIPAGGREQYFLFVPSVDGEYRISSAALGVPQVTLYNSYGDEIAFDQGDGFYIFTALEAGGVYYLRVGYEDYAAASRTITFDITKKPKATAIKIVKNPEKTTFSAYEMSYDGMEVELTLENGTTVQIELDEIGYGLTEGVEESRYEVSRRILTADGEVASYYDEPGSYIAEFYCRNTVDGDEVTVQLPIQITDWKEQATTEIALNTNTGVTLEENKTVDVKAQPKQKNYYYKFTPADTGIYRFQSTVVQPDVSGRAVLYTAERRCLAEDEFVEDGNFGFNVKLKAGTTYYLVVQASTKEAAGSMTFRVDRYSQQCGIYHEWTEVVDKEASCLEAGSKHEECTVCKAKRSETEIPAIGHHSFGEYKVTKAATVLAEGVKERTCSVCGEKETASVAKLKATAKAAKSSLTLEVGKSVSAPKITFGTGDAIKSYKSSKPSVAAVTSKGKITGKKAGTANIVVTLKSGKTVTIKVTVKKVATTKVSVNKKTVTLKKGKTLQLKVTLTPKNSQDKVTYKTSNKKVATVSSKGKITAKGAGTATITITSGSKKATCKVTVK
ncbi:MAG: Ig-like domain-containing protein [Eubacteriales bacterium]|nr:Ig-like domain-containing protein [Eubacteriales bacterium]